MSANPRRIPAHIDPATWTEDIGQTGATDRKSIEAAKRRYEHSGVPLTELRPCDAEGRDGTELPDCVKVYLPAPAGRFGMVFSVDRTSTGPTLAYLAFGVRHQPRDSNAQTVYQLADRRLHG